MLTGTPPILAFGSEDRYLLVVQPIPTAVASNAPSEKTNVPVINRTL